MDEIDQQAKELFQYINLFQRGPAKLVQDVSQGERAMLGWIVSQRKEITPTQLSIDLEISTARVANTLNSLEKKGYIARMHDHEDRRKVYVRPTAEGESFAVEVENKAVENMKQLLGDLGERDAEDYVRIMRKIAGLIKIRENRERKEK